VLNNNIYLIYKDGIRTGLIRIDKELNLKIFPSFLELPPLVNYFDIHYYNGRFFLCGYTLGSDPAGSIDLAAACLDTLGNLIWQTKYSRPGNVSITRRMNFLPNKSFLLTGSIEPKSSGSSCNRIISQNFIEIDTVGNIKRNYRINSDLQEEYPADYFLLPNGKKIFASIYGKKEINGSSCDSYWIPYVSLNDADDKVIKRRFLQEGFFIQNPSIRMSKVGKDFLVACTQYDTTGKKFQSSIYLEKLDSNLNTIWKRKDTLVGVGQELINGIEIMPTGSIIITGTFDNLVTGPRGFIYKVNANGCIDWRLCGTTNTSSPTNEHFNILAFPSPATSSLTLSLEGLWRPGMQWDIYDILGRKIESLPAEAFGTQVDISEINAGIYRAVLMEKGKVLGSVGFSKID
jgi:hypothetical protein